MPQPPYIDVTGRIHHVRTETERERALSEIQHQVVHYLAGDQIPDVETQEQEIERLIGLARFHQGRDFGGHNFGRTLEYTYAVALSGRIYRVNHESLVTWSHRNGNRVGMSTVLLIGIGQEPSQAMLDTLQQQLDYTASRTDMRVTKQRTWGHGETPEVYGRGPDWGNDTDCPGDALGFVRNYRENANVQIPPDTRFFRETGHNLSHGFKDYWEQNGGLAEFGFPLTEEDSGDNFPYNLLPELRGYTVQRFERALLNWKQGQNVQRGRLGALVDALIAAGFEGPRSCACD
jgi:hypothetical protein